MSKSRNEPTIIRNWMVVEYNKECRIRGIKLSPFDKRRNIETSSIKTIELVEGEFPLVQTVSGSYYSLVVPFDDKQFDKLLERVKIE